MKRLLLIWALYSLIFCWISVVVSSCFPNSTCSSWKGHRGVTMLSQQVSALLPKPQADRKSQAAMSHPNRNIWYSHELLHQKCCWVMLSHGEDGFSLVLQWKKPLYSVAVVWKHCMTLGVFTALGGFNTRLKKLWHYHIKVAWMDNHTLVKVVRWLTFWMITWVQTMTTSCIRLLTSGQHGKGKKRWCQLCPIPLHSLCVGGGREGKEERKVN